MSYDEVTILSDGFVNNVPGAVQSCQYARNLRMRITHEQTRIVVTFLISKGSELLQEIGDVFDYHLQLWGMRFDTFKFESKQ